MKRRNCKIAAWALALGLAVMPNMALAAGAEEGASDVSLEEDSEEEFLDESFWEDEGSEADFREDENTDDWEEDEEGYVDFGEDEDADDWEDEEDGWDGNIGDCVTECWDAWECGATDEEKSAGTCGVTGDAESEPEQAAATLPQTGNETSGTAEGTAATQKQRAISHEAEYAASKDPAIAGTYTAMKKTRLQAGAGAEATAFLEVDENTKIYCYGYYTETEGVNWFYVQCFKNGKLFTGFCSSEDLK